MSAAVDTWARPAQPVEMPLRPPLARVARTELDRTRRSSCSGLLRVLEAECRAAGLTALGVGEIAELASTLEAGGR